VQSRLERDGRLLAAPDGVLTVGGGGMGSGVWVGGWGWEWRVGVAGWGWGLGAGGLQKKGGIAKRGFLGVGDWVRGCAHLLSRCAQAGVLLSRCAHLLSRCAHLLSARCKRNRLRHVRWKENTFYTYSVVSIEIEHIPHILYSTKPHNRRQRDRLRNMKRTHSTHIL